LQNRERISRPEQAGEGGPHPGKDWPMSDALKLSPLLVIYLLVILLFSPNGLTHDEPRYLMFAGHLSQGYYTSASELNLWNGPGYPLVLLPFAWLKVPLIWARLLNAFFLFGALIFFHRILSLYLDTRPAFYCSLLFGLFPPLFSHLSLLITETFVIFLICGFAYYYVQTCRSSTFSWGHWLAAGLFGGYLAVTKVLFGYVLLLGLVFFYVLYLWRRKPSFGRPAGIYLLSLVLCTPYLGYTYSLTGKFFYWSDAGGLSLYCMTTPYEEEYGDYFGETKIRDNLPWIKHHGKFFYEDILPRSLVEQDEVFKKQALRNIVDHPLKLIKNWLANWGRLFFNYPYSYTTQKLSTYAYMIPNMFLVVMMTFSLIPTVLRRRSIPQEIFGLLFWACVALGGSSLLSAYVRQFIIVTPLFFLWIIFVWMKIVKIELIKEAK
jgi:hypothetical protein